MKDYEFIFGDIPSSFYDVMICSMENANNYSTNEEATNEIITKSIGTDSWSLHGTEYTTPLSFKITILDKNGKSLDIVRQNSLKKWLCKEKREWLCINTYDYIQPFYYCRFTNPTREIIFGNIVGLTFTVVCDAPYGYSPIQEYKYTVNGTKTFKLILETNYVEKCIYPKITIKKATGTIKIVNYETGEVVIIDNCVNTETITLVCGKDIISTDSSHDVISDWNKKTISLIDGVNELFIIGSCEIKFEYRLPMRVGG